MNDAYGGRASTDMFYNFCGNEEMKYILKKIN
jgi:hypothetical protein